MQLNVISGTFFTLYECTFSNLIKCMHHILYKYLINAIRRDFRDFFTLYECTFSNLIKCMHHLLYKYLINAIKRDFRDFFYSL